MNNYKKLALDTNIFIYYIETNGEFSKSTNQLFTTIQDQRLHVYTSVTTVTELLSLSASPDIIKSIEEFLARLSFVEFVPIDMNIASIAASMRRKYNIRFPDAIQLATAINQRADIFVTNDKKLTRCKEIKVILLPQINI